MRNEEVLKRVEKLIDQEDPDPEEMVEIGKRIGELLAGAGLSSTQVYRFFGVLRRIEMKERPRIKEKELDRQSKRELSLLKPRLAWQAARPGLREGFGPLRDIFTKCIDVIGDDRRKFLNFMDFAEAILAYHRALGR
jgi:CRISPR type III-A-associated protein Csm2